MSEKKVRSLTPEQLEIKVGQYQAALDKVSQTSKNLGGEAGPARFNYHAVSGTEKIARIKKMGEIRQVIYEKTLPILQQNYISLNSQEPAGWGILYGIAPDLKGDISDFTSLHLHPKVERYIAGLDQTLGLAVSSFLQSNRGQWILTKIKNFAPENELQSWQFEGHSAGLVFQDIGHFYLEYKYGHPGIFLLSPMQIFNTYRILFPEKEVVVYYGINFAITDQSFPDGMVIREDGDALILDSVIEYKAGRTTPLNSLRFTNQIENFRKENITRDFNLDHEDKNNSILAGQLIHRVKPEIPAKPLIINPLLELVYVIPENSKLDIPGARIERIPMDTIELNQFLKVLQQAVREY